MRLARNAVGAFADGAVLFPLLSVLSSSGGFSGSALLASAGLTYLAAGVLFRVPMAVQPLKSIAIASVAVGASSGEVRLAGFLLGVALLSLLLAPVARLADRVPSSFVQALQAALGVLLILQGGKAASGLSSESLALSLAMTAVTLLLPIFSDVPILGLLATLGLFWGVFTGQESGVTVPARASGGLRPEIVATLVFPQVALTLGNSVLGTRDVARRYFGAAARRVTVERLLTSIGLGNILTSLVGGLPFCHGSGGITAHVRGGADHWGANLIIGFTLLALAAFHGAFGGISLDLPLPLLATLFFSIGIFHLGLARPTWGTRSGKARLVIAVLLAATTRNMLAVFTVAAAVEGISRWIATQRARRYATAGRLA